MFPNFVNPNAPQGSPPLQSQSPFSQSQSPPSQSQIQSAISNAFPDMTDDQLDAMVQMASTPEGLDLLKQKLGDANDLANTEMPTGRRAGGMYVAANPLEVLGAGVKQGIGIHQRQQLQGQEQDLLDKNSASRRVLGQGLAGQSGGAVDALLRMLGGTGTPSNYVEKY